MNFPRPGKGASLRLAAISLVSASALVIGNSAGVFAALNARATNGSGQLAKSGTLLLTLGNAGASAGLTGTISNLAPGDAEVRYVDLQNGGTLDAAALSLAIAASGDAVLVSDTGTSKALTVAVESCSQAWTQATGACSGSTVSELTAATVSSYSTARGLNSSAPTAGSTLHLKITTTLPDQTETSVDGQLPTATVQNKSVTLTYTFSETQRTARTVQG